MKTAKEGTPLLFSVSVSQSGSKYSFLDAPPHLVHNLSASLRNMFPRRIASDHANEDGVFIIEIRKSSTGPYAYDIFGATGMLIVSHLAPDVDRSVLSAFILGYFNSMGFKLDGSIPLGKTTPLGFGSRKELWVFRSMQARSGSASGHNSVNGQSSAHGHGEY